MSSLKYRRLEAIEAIETPSPGVEAARRLAALGLRKTSALLARLARRLACPVARVSHPIPRLEFYAEAGAPEGALYLDGALVGRITGVSRL